MLASIFNRRLLALLLVVVAALLLLTLYKMQTLSSFIQQNRHDGSLFSFLQSVKGPEEEDVSTDSPVPLLTSRQEQEQAVKTLFKVLITDRPDYRCEDVKHIKNKMEGAWKFCGDKHFALRKPCLVYSFGINYDFTFDDAIGKLGCEVFSFDPSMNTSDHRRNPHVMFYQTGLGAKDTDSYVPNLNSYVKTKTTWKMRTLKTLMNDLGHSGRTLDLLKIDIESSEWAVVRNMLNTGVLRQVKQFLLEWHLFPKYPPKENFLRYVRLLQDVKEAGFRVFDKHPHPHNFNWDEFNIQSDIGYVNINFMNSTK